MAQEQKQQQVQTPKTFFLGTNTEATIDGSILTLRIDLTERHGDTSTGASEMVSGTGGYQIVPNHPDLKVSCMVIKPHPKAPRR